MVFVMRVVMSNSFFIMVFCYGVVGFWKLE